jgi:nitrate reductase gamma subunit
MEAPAGWYPDPKAEADERYWDGATWTEKTRQEETASILNPHIPPGGLTLQRSGVSREDSALLASMGYLHSIALVVISGVVVGFAVGVGLLFSLVLQVVEIAAIFFVMGAILGIAMLIGSIVALIRADADRSQARKAN